MNELLSQEELAAAIAARTAQTTQTEPPANIAATTTTSTETNTNTDPPPANSSLTEAEIAAQTQATEAATLAAAEAAKNAAPVKSFEDYLKEKTQGKFEKWEDVEQIINTPKEEFADDEVRHWNDLKKKGVKLDKEFFELQSLDLTGGADGIVDPEYVLLQAMKRKEATQGLSDKTLHVELNKKYNYDEWKGKEEADLTDIDLANREIMLRDAKNDLNYLENYKKERTFVNQPTAEQITQQREEAKRGLERFEQFLDKEVFEKITSLSIPIDEATKESFDYKLSEADRKDAINMMKLMATSGDVLLDQFAYKDEKGAKQYHHNKIFEMITKAKTFNEAVKNAYNDGKAVGAKTFVKEEIKNVSFTPTDGKTANPVAQTEGEALALALAASGKKLI